MARGNHFLDNIIEEPSSKERALGERTREKPLLKRSSGIPKWNFDLSDEQGQKEVATNQKNWLSAIDDILIDKSSDRDTEEEIIDLSPSAERDERRDTSGSDTSSIPGYGEGITKDIIEDIIRTEAKLRNMGVDASLKIFNAEGASSYQSKVRKGSQKKEGGREASYGPFQLYTGIGLGKEYEKETGVSLAEDNTLEGITRQIQFALDKAAEGKSWQPWYGRKKAGVAATEGLTDAKPLYNWRKE